MAEIGGGAAFQRLQVPQDGMGQALQYWGAQQGRENAAVKLADEREGIRKKKEVEEWEDTFGLKEGDFANKYTGFKSFDDMNTDFSMYATKEYVNLQRKAKEAMLSGDMTTKNKLEADMIRLKNSFGEAAKSQEFFGKKYESYQKAVSEGKVSGASKEFEDIVQQAILNKNMALRMKDGNLVYTTLVNGEPKVIPYQDMMDGSFGWYEKQQVSGKGGLVDNILNNLGSVVREEEDGYYSITTQAWDDGKEGGMHTKATEDAIEAMLGNDEVMGDLLYQFSGGKKSKMFKFEEDDYKLVKGKLKELVRAGYDEKFGKEFNSGKYNARNPKTTGKVNESAIEAYPVTDTNNTQEDGKFTLKTKGGKPISGIYEANDKASVTAMKVDDNGEMFIQIIQEPTGIEGVMEGGTSSQWVKPTSEEINRIASRMGLGTQGELYKYLQEIRSQYRQKQTTVTPATQTTTKAPTGGNVR